MIEYLFIIPLTFLYTIGIDSLLYDYFGVPPTTNFLGAAPPNEQENVIESAPQLDAPQGTLAGVYKKRTYLLTMEMSFYALLHVCLSYVPGYLTCLFISRMVYCSLDLCRMNLQDNNPYYNKVVIIIKGFMNFFRIGNYLINKINSVTGRWFKIKKTAESLATWSILPIAIISVSLFYFFKKFFTKKDQKYPDPHTRPQETRSQSMINLGLMILSFIGYSNFGLWKQFRDWVQHAEYINKVFGDAASETTCKNFNPSKYNKDCRGTKKGNDLCLSCTGAKIEKAPVVTSRVSLDFSINSVMENPAVYFYPLVNVIVQNYDTENPADKIPLWYKRLPEFLQRQIFESHYATIADLNTFPKKCRLTPEKLLAGEYVVQRDDKLGKWVLITSEHNEINKRFYAVTNNRGKTIRTFDNQYLVEPDSDSDQETYQAARQATDLVVPPDEEEKINPHTTMTNEHQMYYADAFALESEEKQQVSSAIPFLQQLPDVLKQYYKPVLFISAMCLILYGYFYYYRKKRLEMLSKLENKAVAILVERELDAQSIPPVLMDDDGILDVNKIDPETYQSRMKDRAKKSARTTIRHHNKQEEDTSEFTVQGKQLHAKLKRNKQRNYIMYNPDDLDKLLRQGGVFMIGPDGTGKTATTRQEYEILKSQGYQADENDLMKIKQGTIDLSRLDRGDDKQPINFNVLRFVTQRLPLTIRQYKYIRDLLDDGMNPDMKWNLNFDSYKFVREENAYICQRVVKDYDDVPEARSVTILKKPPEDEVKQQDIALSSPVTTTPEQYEKYKQLTEDYVSVLSNPDLSKILHDNLNKVVVAQPETNVATVHSKICPFGNECGLKGCFLEHPEAPQPEAMNGHVKIDHYPNNMDTQNAYKIFLSGEIGPHHAMCNYTKLGFLTNDHAMYFDKHTKEQLIPPGGLEIEVRGVRYPIEEFVKFPEIRGGNNKVLPEVFQDMVVCKIKAKLDLKPAKAKAPRNGEKVMIVSANQQTEEGYLDTPSSLRTQETVITLQEDGMFHFNSNNKPGDSGSPVYSLDQNFAQVGVYFGQVKRGVNTLIPIDNKYLPNINGGVSFQLTKNSRPTV